MRTFDFDWQIGLVADQDCSQQELNDRVKAVNEAIVNAAAEIVSTFPNTGNQLEIAARCVGKTQRVVRMRKAFHISSAPRAVDEHRFASAGAAIDHLMRTRETLPAETAKTLTLVKDTDGQYRLAQREWDSCAFDTQVEAEDAMQAFEDGSGFVIFPFVDVSALTYDAE